MANRNPLLAVLRELRNVPRDRIINRKPAAFDLLRDGDRGHRFSRRKPQAQCVRRHRDTGAALADGEFSDTLSRDGGVELCAEVQTLGDAGFD